MALKKKPVTGMKDILPGEMEIRDYVLNIIKDTYRGYGFSASGGPGGGTCGRSRLRAWSTLRT